MNLPNILTKNALGYISTADSNGPSGASIFYAFKDDEIIFMTHTDSLKARHVRANPQVCLTVVDAKNYEQIQLYGSATEKTSPSKEVDILLEVIEREGTKREEFYPYINVETQHGLAVFGITPNRYKLLVPGQGLKEIKL